MAKSIRSKWRRKMRAVKREKFGKKELERLKDMLQKAEVQDVDMKEVCTVKSSKEVKAETSEKMETNQSSKKYDSNTLKDEHGNFPVWMNQRKVRKWKKELKRKEKKKIQKKKQNVL